MINRLRRHLTTATFAAVAFTLVACSDAPMAASDSSTSLKPEGAKLTLASTSVTTATLYPQYDNMYVSVEGHRIVIPAYSICKVATSGYGPGYWNQSCEPERNPITFTITTSVDTDKSSRVTVKPDVRFSPSKQVMAYFKDQKGAAVPGSYIAYCTLLSCIDEGKTDSQMTTFRDPSQGIIYRRLKHFSGYNVVFGFGDAASRASSMNVAPLSANFFSGYITTVGFDGNGNRQVRDFGYGHR